MISKIKRIFQIFFKNKISFKKLEKKEILFFIPLDPPRARITAWIFFLFIKLLVSILSIIR